MTKTIIRKFISGLPHEKVTGGEEIEIEVAPWTCSIEYDNNHIGGGAIVSDQYSGFAPNFKNIQWTRLFSSHHRCPVCMC